MNINGVAKPNAIETSGFPNASRQHRNDQNKIKRWGCSKIGKEHRIRKLFGKPEVSKTLGFAVHRVWRAQINSGATGYNGRRFDEPALPNLQDLKSAPLPRGIN